MGGAVFANLAIEGPPANGWVVARPPCLMSMSLEWSSSAFEREPAYAGSSSGEAVWTPSMWGTSSYWQHVRVGVARIVTGKRAMPVDPHIRIPW